MISTEPVLLERLGDGVARITLNRPAARNAVNGAMADMLDSAVTEVERDPAVRVVILTGAGDRAFCAGADLTTMADGTQAQLWTEAGGFAGFVDAPKTKVWIAAVRGFALAGGCEIMLACDLVIASEDASFGIPEVKRGLIAGAGGLVRLPHAIPRAIAVEMAVTGAPISAARALQLGLINKVVATERVEDDSVALAREISSNAPLAVAESLALIRRAQDGTDAARHAASLEALGRVLASEDRREGAKAFLEKRAPRWQGR